MTKKLLIEKGSTFFLKSAVVFAGLIVMVFCFFVLKVLLTEKVLGGYAPILIGMLIAAIPFFIGELNVLKLLNYIDRKKIYSKSSLKALVTIRNCGLIIAGLYGSGMPYIFKVADSDDAPGVVLLGLIFTFAPLTVAVFSEIFRKALKRAIKLKNEAELTV